MAFFCNAYVLIKKEMMRLEKMIPSNNLREGITTGTCAAAAAQASVRWQISGQCPENVRVDTPSGKTVCLAVIQEDFLPAA